MTFFPHTHFRLWSGSVAEGIIWMQRVVVPAAAAAAAVHRFSSREKLAIQIHRVGGNITQLNGSYIKVCI